MSGEQAHPPQASTGKPERRQLFINYSHKDREWVERLRTMLRPLEQRHGLDRWDDSRIRAGMLWREEIEKALASAQVALLMVSADFLASDFVTREELPPLFHAAREEGLRILWVPLRPCLWNHIPEIERYQAVIPPGRTVAEMGEVEQERAFVEIAECILSTFQEEAERQARRRREEQERLAGQQEALERKAEQERLEREREESRSQEAERERLARERQEEKQRQACEEEERRALAEAERWKAEAERLAREKEALVRKSERETQRGADDPEARTPALPEGAERSHFGPLETATLRRAASTWVIQPQVIDTWGFRERLAEGVDLELVAIPAGSFLIGSPADEPARAGDEGPQHEVQLEGFFLAQTPITQAQWQVVAAWEKVERDLDPDPSRFKGANRPVEQVNWFEAVEFCRRLSERTGRRYGLPSEAQWEYACRAGTTTPFHFGATLTAELANYDGTFLRFLGRYNGGPKGVNRKETTAVGTFPANHWGLHDVHGNVWEWCEDHWHDNYQGAPVNGCSWLIPAAGSEAKRLLRGGSWNSAPRHCRSAYRNGLRPGLRSSGIGFRVCCLPPGFSS